MVLVGTRKNSSILPSNSRWCARQVLWCLEFTPPKRYNTEKGEQKHKETFLCSIPNSTLSEIRCVFMLKIHLMNSCCQQGFLIPTMRRTSAAIFEDFRPSKSIETSVKHGHLGRALEWNQPTIQPSPPLPIIFFEGWSSVFFFTLITKESPGSRRVAQLSLPTKWHDYSPMSPMGVFFETTLLGQHASCLERANCWSRTANRWVSTHQQKFQCFAHPSCMEVVPNHWSSTSSSPKLTASLIPRASKYSRNHSFRQH